MTNNNIRMVRELKGAPLSILVVLAMIKNPCRQEYLERTTGYTDKPVSQALVYLAEIGLVVHIPSTGWVLTAQARMIPGIGAMLPDPEEASPAAEIIDDETVEDDPIDGDPVDGDPAEVEAVDNSVDKIEKSRNISDSPVVVKLRESDSELKINSLSDSVLTPEKAEKFRLVQDLRSCGVYLQTAQELAEQFGEEAIRKAIGYYWHALATNLAQGPGWLVQAVREGWGEPLGWKAGGSGRCVCARCLRGAVRDTSDYADWEEDG